MPIYFGNHHSPWQLGSNENANGLLRENMRKGNNLSKHSGEDLMRIQRSVIGRPRKTLDYSIPVEKLARRNAPTD